MKVVRLSCDGLCFKGGSVTDVNCPYSVLTGALSPTCAQPHPRTCIPAATQKECPVGDVSTFLLVLYGNSGNWSRLLCLLSPAGT